MLLLCIGRKRKVPPFEQVQVGGDTFNWGAAAPKCTESLFPSAPTQNPSRKRHDCVCSSDGESRRCLFHFSSQPLVLSTGTGQYSFSKISIAPVSLLGEIQPFPGYKWGGGFSIREECAFHFPLSQNVLWWTNPPSLVKACIKGYVSKDLEAPQGPAGPLQSP